MSGGPYGSWPPAARRALVKRALRDCRVLTRQQLAWRGLADASRALGLASVQRTCRTRTTQEHSAVTLEFVAADDRWLQRSPRDLMHWAGLAELWFATGWREGGLWRLIDASGRHGSVLPDAEVLWRADAGVDKVDMAVEVDAGYTRSVIERKVQGLYDQGYRGVMWGTTVHARVRTLTRLVDQMTDDGRLPWLRRLHVRYVNMWSVHDPYVHRPRCHKLLTAQRDYVYSRYTPEALSADVPPDDYSTD